ncbi:MAG: hypothetical protein ABIO38_05955, partial [Luteimonas sp.]
MPEVFCSFLSSCVSHDFLALAPHFMLSRMQPSPLHAFARLCTPLHAATGHFPREPRERSMLVNSALRRNERAKGFRLAAGDFLCWHKE